MNNHTEQAPRVDIIRLTNQMLSALQDGREQDAAAFSSQIGSLISATGNTRFHVYCAADDSDDLWEGAIEAQSPTMLTREDGKTLVYPGKSHTLVAEPTAGKSWVAVSTVLQLAQDGKRALFVDFEDDYRSFVKRFRQLGGTRELMSNVRYARFEGGDIMPVLCQMYSFAGEWHPDLVVLDGVAQSMMRLRLNELDNADINRWTNLVIAPLLDTGAATLALDHISRASKEALAEQGKSREARGGTAKIADVTGAHYTLVVGEPFAKGTPGYSRLFLGKDRPGEIGITKDSVVAIVRYKPFTESTLDGALRVTLEAPLSTEEMALLDEQTVWDFVAENEPVKRFEIEQKCGLRRAAARDAIAALVGKKALSEEKEAGRGAPRVLVTKPGTRPTAFSNKWTDDRNWEAA